jgi:thymidylate synthase
MRVFTRFPEAIEEIRRDLAEMGIDVHTKTMQDKNIEHDASFATKEIQNYSYTVTDARFEDLKPTQPWADAEWQERLDGINGNPINPGVAWKLRKEVWEQFLERHPRYGDEFSYTYSEQFNEQHQVRSVINRLKVDPASRQLYVAMWAARHSMDLGNRRVPCSLGWHFQCRGGQLNMTYLMRSCDFATHFQNDIYLALKLQDYVASEAGIKRGHFTQTMFSLHVYRKDLANVF